MVELIESANGRVLEVHLSGKLTQEDYQQFVPNVEKNIREHGKISILLFMKDFHGWSPGALWADLKFSLRHFTDLERIAMIGETRWQSGMAAFCKPFTTAQIRYFDPDHADEARAWLEGQQEIRAV